MVVEHQNIRDERSMYPFAEKPSGKAVLKSFWLPAVLVQILFFILAYLGTRNVGWSETVRVVAVSAMALLPPTVFVLAKTMSGIKISPWKYFAAYEMGRRMIFSVIISLGAAFAVVFYVVLRWHFLSLLQIHLLLIPALLLGNFILFAMDYELASYIMFGVLTFLVGALSYTLADSLVIAQGWKDITGSWMIGQGFSFVMAVLFAYLTNRYFVFKDRGNFWLDLLRFVGARIFSSLVLEFLGMYIMVELLHLDRDLAKQVGAFAVTVANYFLSKFFVFKKSGSHGIENK